VSSHINLRGHQVWSSEWANNGEPLVLLHGGMSATENWDTYLLPACESTHHVFGYDRTGQGRTGDQLGSFHFDFQTREAIAYLEDIVKGPAHLVGWSDGGIIALMVAIARPDLVKSIVAIGANFHFNNGGIPIPDWPITEEDRIEHATRSPDAPETLDGKVARLRAIWKSEPTMTLADLSRIQCPTLVLVGDDELFSLEHTTALYESIPQGQLAVIPGTSHFVIKEKPELTQMVIRDFLANTAAPITRAPVRRTNP